MSSTTILKALTESGTGSRRKMAVAIKQGLIRVNGQVVTDFRHPVNPDTDAILYNGRRVNPKPAGLVYLMLNKPKGVLSTASDERERETVLDILSPKYHGLRLYPAGRLDKDTTGLLILTNDGDLTYRLTHPKFEHEKEYLVSIEGTLQKDELKKLEEGAEMEERPAYPAIVREVKSMPPFTYSITIHEGGKRQVRLMLESLGHHVAELKRVRMGSLKLGDLKEGEVRELNTSETRALLDK